MISVDSGALLIIGSFTKQVNDPDFKVSILQFLDAIFAHFVQLLLYCVLFFFRFRHETKFESQGSM